MLSYVTNSNKTNIFDKNPVNGGIPAIEKNTTTKEKHHKALLLLKLDKLEINNELIAPESKAATLE